jgi:hypothetical protein
MLEPLKKKKIAESMFVRHEMHMAGTGMCLVPTGNATTRTSLRLMRKRIEGEDVDWG